MFSKYFSFFFIPVLAALVPYLACQFFDSPLLHGIFSAEEFFLLLALALPYGKILWKLPFAVAIFGYAFYANSIDGFAVAGIYLLMFLFASLVPRQKKYLLPVFVAFSLFFLVADCGNFFYSTFVLKLSDVWGLAKFFWWGSVLFVALPVVVVALQYFYARKILWGESRLEISHPVVLAIVLISVGVNYGVNCIQQRQSIMEFPVKSWFWQLFTPGIIGQNSYLQEDIKSEYRQWDSALSVVKDFSKPTVMVLVESYGVNKSVEYNKALFASYANYNPHFMGLYFRHASHTQGAEWEDFNTPGGKVKSESVPVKFKANGLQTWYLHGYDGSFYERNQNYAKFGFDSLLFKDDLDRRRLSSCKYGFTGICDSAIISYMDSLLADSVPKFIYWTTLDSHPPYEKATVKEKSSACKSLELSDIDCTFFTLQENTAKNIAWLANRHPEYTFVIRGDHRPMGAATDASFVQSFYFKWVPLIILNR